MRKVWRRRVAHQQRKALACLSEAISAAFSQDSKGRVALTGRPGPVAVAYGECCLSRAAVDGDTVKMLHKAGIG